MRSLTAIVGCEKSGVFREALRRYGVDAMSADLQETDVQGPHYKGDVFDVMDYPWDIGIFHFPCTNTAVSGARWFKQKRLQGLQQVGVSMFLRGWKAAAHIAHVAFEHPVSVINTVFREPDQIMQPHEYWHLDESGKGEVKATCWWLRGLRPFVSTTPNETGRHPACWLMGPSDTRADDRSKTYPGIADAMAKQIVEQIEWLRMVA